MTNDRRDLVDAMIAAITTDVEAAVDWDFHRARPIHHRADTEHCAVYWMTEVPDNPFNTTGSMEMIPTYRIEYWRPNPDRASGLVVDEDLQLEIEDTMASVKAVVFANQETPQAYQLWFAGAQPYLEEPAEAVSGFLIEFTGRTREVWT